MDPFTTDILSNGLSTSLSYNETRDTDSPGLTLGFVIAGGFGLYFLAVITFVGNAMVLHAIRTEKRLQTVSNSFVFERC